ncbi:MAG: hypothetical protein ACR2MG_08275 [Pyrinomonadaceae bacterium]
MKIKILTIFSLAAVLLLGGCRGDANVNANMANRMNANTNMTAATPMMPTMDTATKSAVEAALKGKGFTDVTVDATTAGVTLRGSVAKGKMAEAVQVAQEAGKKPVKNELTEK